MYKDTVAPDIMQTKGGDDDIPEGGNALAEDEMDDSTDSSNSGQSQGDDIVHKTPPRGRETKFDKGGPRTRWLGIPVR